VTTVDGAMTGHDFLLALADAGVISPTEMIRRVVVDASIDGPIVLRVERYGDKRLLDLQMPSGRDEIRSTEEIA